MAVLKQGLFGRLEGFSRRGETLADLEGWDCILSAAEVESPCQCARLEFLAENWEGGPAGC